MLPQKPILTRLNCVNRATKIKHKIHRLWIIYIYIFIYLCIHIYIYIVILQLFIFLVWLIILQQSFILYCSSLIPHTPFRKISKNWQPVECGMSEILPQCYRNVQHAISSSYNFMVFFSFLFPSVPFILCYKKVVNSVVWLSSNSKRSCRRIWDSRNQILHLTCVSGLRFVKSFYFIHNLGWHILMLAWFIKSFCDVELFPLSLFSIF